MREVGGDIHFCVLTGGEPLLQIDAGLIEALHQHNFWVAIETNGTVSLQESCWNPAKNELTPPDWIVCSPKLSQEKLSLEYFDELKLVLPDYAPSLYAGFVTRQRTHTVQAGTLPLLWLQPEDGPRVKASTQAAIDYALSHPSWRVSVQTHKILNVD
jgi:organic radical activating enzyme